MRRCTLSICLAIALAIALCGASAEAGLEGVFKAQDKQTDFPNLGLYLQVLDPRTNEPLLVMGPDKQPIECPPSQTPRDSTVRAIFLPNPGSRTTVCVKNREQDGIREPDMTGGPYFHDYTAECDSKTYLLGPHIVKGVVKTDEKRWEPKAEIYSRRAFTAADVRYCLPSRTAPPPQPPTPERAAPAPRKVTLYLTNGSRVNEVRYDDLVKLPVAGDVLAFRIHGQSSHVHAFATAKVAYAEPGSIYARMQTGVGRDVQDADMYIRGNGGDPK